MRSSKLVSVFRQANTHATTNWLLVAAASATTTHLAKDDLTMQFGRAPPSQCPQAAPPHAPFVTWEFRSAPPSPQVPCLEFVQFRDSSKRLYIFCLRICHRCRLNCAQQEQRSSLAPNMELMRDTGGRYCGAHVATASMSSRLLL